MKQLLLILLVLAGPAVAGAGPRDSLLPDDPRVELAARRLALGERLGEGVAVFFPAPDGGLFDARPDPNLFWLTGIDEPVVLLLVIERPEATAKYRAAMAAAERLERRADDLAGKASDLRRAGDREGANEASRGRADALDAMSRALDLAKPEGGAVRVTSRLYLPPENAGRRLWTGEFLAATPVTAEETGMDEVRPTTSLPGDLASLAVGTRVWTTTRPGVPGPFTREESRLRLRGDLRASDPSRDLAALRMVKSPEEIARIRRACELTAEGLADSMRACRPGMREYELQAVLEFACRRGGAVRQAFRSIVASGSNTTVLHHYRNRRTIEDGDLVLMDVGAEFMGYAADVTRTFPANGTFSKEQAETYDLVLRAQLAGIAAVRPGATLRDVDGAAREIIAKAGYGGAFRHSTSHWVGVDVHDPGTGGALAPGMVLTVEPGIYLPERGFGIRIEDTVLVTADGVEVLSRGIPKDRETIEKLMASSSGETPRPR